MCTYVLSQDVASLWILTQTDQRILNQKEDSTGAHVKQ